MNGGAIRAQQNEVHLLNVSYAATRELYGAFDPLFAAYWKKKTGRTVTIAQSYGSSGAQARAVVAGLDADVTTLALGGDIDAISRAGLVDPKWQSRLPTNSSPYTSTITFVVRKGNPKNIRDWNDLVKPGVGIVTPNPKTSGAARWNLLAAWAYASRRDRNNDAQTRTFVGQLYKNAVVLDADSRTATASFAERGLGDVLVNWENEAYYLLRSQPGKYELVTPSVSILAEPSVAWVDKNVAQHGTADAAKAFLEYLYSEPAQELACRYGYRPTLTSVYGKCPTHFARLELWTIANFGGWKTAQEHYFADGGVFDQIYNTK
ncbi:MAG TPA: sulfate ABC transporter substrate-binding protein [Candidatus Lustribacter sp.]|nr:sulfate ABC transporter substrate-binding protein [Candidatus Lustribacter sp.]